MLAVIVYGIIISTMLITSIALLLKTSHIKYQTDFLYFSIALVIWQSAFLIADLSSTLEVQLWLVRFGLVAGSFMMYFFARFTRFFTQKKGELDARVSTLHKIFLLTMVVLSIAPFTVSNLERIDDSLELANPGIGYTLHSLLAICFFIWGLSLVIARYKLLSKVKKNQIVLIIAGMIVFSTVNIVTSFLFLALDVKSDASTTIGQYSVFAIIILSWYAVFKHRLFNIRYVISRGISFVVVYTIVILCITTLIAGLSLNAIDVENENIFVLTIGIISTSVAFLIVPLKKIIERLSARIFYRDSYDSERVISEYSSKMIGCRTQQALDVITKDMILSSIKPTHVEIIHDQVTQLSKRKKAKVGFFELAQNPLESDTLHEYAYSFGTSNLLPTTILLGDKKSGTRMTTQDKRLLADMASLYELGHKTTDYIARIEQFNDELKQAVDKATEKLKKTNKSLEDVSKSKDEFMSMATHQIRPQLTAVKGFVEMIHDKVRSKEIKELTMWSGTGIDRSLRIIADMLNLSKFSQGELTLNRTKTDIVKLIKNEISSAHSILQSAEITIVFTPDRDSAFINGDVIKLQEVIANIIHNAIQYSNKNTMVEVALSTTKHSYRFSVRDYGIGVPQGQEKELFTKFYRTTTAKNKRANGTGIGLYLASRVIEAHGGSVFFERPTDIKSGSVFGFTLPR